MFDQENTVFVFPGQGSQKVGMAKDFYETEVGKKLFDKADEVLGRNISSIMFEGSQEELNQTNNAQLALFIAGFVACEVIKANEGKQITDLAKYVAGHSLGEYTALAQAGVFSFEDGLKLVDKRAKAMFEATQSASGSMAAILNLDIAKVNEVAEKTNTVVANNNTIGQIVISGEKENIVKACGLAKEMGAKRAIELPVSGAFHSPLMQSAADVMAQHIDALDMNDATIPVVMNVSGQAVTDVATIKENMKKQITGSVKWLESMTFMQDNGIETVAEFGAGNVLCGLFKKFNKELSLNNFTTTEKL
ncbi:MAG TPA: [acyl-carrier-protein] S-malonyltransferase [Alphaproteobacteria bacterium]|nr:[acyl-carrier-protein] S-malonyltransferase [Alphaproteobacteria bacterium]